MLEQVKSTGFYAFAWVVLLFAALGPHSLALSFVFLLAGVAVFVLLLLLGLGVRDVIVLSVVVNFVFIAFYFPVFGSVLGWLGEADVQVLKIYVGVRSFIYGLLLLFALALLFVSDLRRMVLRHELLYFGLGIGCLIFFFLNSPAPLFGRITYLFNSFLPLVLTLIAIVWLATRQGVGVSSSRILYRAAFIVALLCVGYALCIDFLYTYVRPDLVSVMRTNSLEPLSYGSYPGSWRTVIGSFYFNRLVGVFPDPIVSGYFFAFFAAASWVMRKYLAFCIGLILLLLSFSKGAWIFLFTFALIYHLLLLKIRAFWLPVLVVAGMQILASTMFHSSAYVHYQGLVGAISSLLAAPAKMVLGFGVGVGGNLDAFAADNWDRASSLATGAESGVGVLLFQLGLLGVGLLVWLMCYTNKQCYRNYKITGNNRFLAIIALIGALTANAFLQENCINSSLLGLLLYFCCVLSCSHVEPARNGVVHV